MHGRRSSGRRSSGKREASSEGFVKRTRLLAGTLMFCLLAATAGCSQSGNASGPGANGGAAINSTVARDWAAVEDGLETKMDAETRAAVERASRGDASAQGSVAPDTIRAGS